MDQLRRLQALFMNSSNKPAQTGTCILVSNVTKEMKMSLTSDRNHTEGFPELRKEQDAGENCTQRVHLNSTHNI